MSGYRCHFCDQEMDQIGYGLPFYEGRVDWNSDFSAPVCKDCHDKETAKRFPPLVIGTFRPFDVMRRAMFLNSKV